MKNFHFVIVYNSGSSRTTSVTKNNKHEAFLHVLETDMEKENIVTITAIEAVREDF